MQLWGISDAVGVALREAAPRRTQKISIFSDSQAAIKELQDSKRNAGQALRIQIYRRVNQLQARGGKVTVRWIPSHSGIEGNEQADKAAKDAAANGRSQSAQWSSLAHVNRKIKEAKKLEICSWHQARNEEREIRIRSYYVPRLQSPIIDYFIYGVFVDV